jgi:uncharacterized Zn finger protein (UPF0148 family)
MYQVCPKCKNTVDANQLICPYCGIKFSTYVKELESESRQNKIANITLDASDDIIRREIIQSLKDLQYHEAGSKWDSIATLISGNPAERIMADMLKAMVDQNKIIIRQNELNRRILEKIAEKS